MKKHILLSSVAMAAVMALPLSATEAQARPGNGARASVSVPSHGFAGRPAFSGRTGATRLNNGNARFNNGTGRFNGNRHWNGNGNWAGNNWRHHHHHGRIYYGYYPYYSFYPWGGYGYGYYPYGYYDNGYYGDGYYSYRSRNNGSLASNIQVALSQSGYYRGPIDGVIGPRTRSAIRAYERANGLPVDGLVDPRLVATMGLG